ncbi:uncharacterized protein TM35_000011940, partial [Trypanosoma theileri]
MSVTGVLPEKEWQQPSKIKYCQYQDCGASFGIFSSKINCRRCGIVMCSKCSITCDSITGHYSNKPQPVCPRCFDIIEKQKKRFSRISTQQTPSLTRRNSTDSISTTPQHELSTALQEQETKVKQLEQELTNERNTRKALEDQFQKQITAIMEDKNASLQEVQELRVKLSQTQHEIMKNQESINCDASENNKGNLVEPAANADELQSKLDSVCCEREQLQANADELQSQL